MDPKKLTQALLLSACLAGFIWQIWDQAGKFLSGFSTVAVSWEQKKTLSFPTFVFCDSQGFTVTSKGFEKALRNRDSFKNHTVEVHVYLSGIGTHEFGNRETPEYDSYELPTLYNGMCKVFTIRTEYPIRHFAEFTLEFGKRYHVFFVDEGEEKFIVVQNFLNMPTAIEIGTTALVDIKKSVLKVGEDHCMDYTTADMANCFFDKVAQRVKENGTLECVAFMHGPLMPSLQTCENASFMTAIGVRETECLNFYGPEGYHFHLLFQVQNILGKTIVDIADTCKRPCSKNHYKIRESKLATVVGDKNFMAWFLYSSDFVKESQEYVLMDFPNIVSAIGGSLGLFLGFSCYGMIWDLLQRWFPWRRDEQLTRRTKRKRAKFLTH